MNLPDLLRSLERFGHALPHVVGKVSDEESRWKPPGGAWSILEIVCHLADEEELDFGARLRSTLADPSAPWPQIDPEGWAVERKYNDGRLDDAVARFTKLRGESLAWLRSLDAPDWQRAYQHPQF